MSDRRRLARNLAIGIAALAVAGLAGSALMFASWTEVRIAEPADAANELARTLAGAGGGPAYVEISPQGTVSVRRDLERQEPVKLASLRLMAWDPQRGKLLRMDIPFWFVRIKMTSSLNLGTLTSALARDWQNLDLRVSEDDLERRGPGLVLDHTRSDGARVLLWTESAPP